MWNKKNLEEKVLKSVFVEVDLRILALNVPKSKTLNAIISELLFCDLSTFRTGLFKFCFLRRKFLLQETKILFQEAKILFQKYKF